MKQRQKPPVAPDHLDELQEGSERLDALHPVFAGEEVVAQIVTAEAPPLHEPPQQGEELLRGVVVGVLDRIRLEELPHEGLRKLEQLVGLHSPAISRVRMPTSASPTRPTMRATSRSSTRSSERKRAPVRARERASRICPRKDGVSRRRLEIGTSPRASSHPGSIHSQPGRISIR